MADAEALVDRAKRAGRNRVERVDGYSGAPDARSHLTRSTESLPYPCSSS